MTITSAIAVSPQIQLNDTISGDQTNASLGRLASGGFAAAWFDWGNGDLESQGTLGGDGDLGGIRTRIYTASGTKVLSELVANTATIGWQQNPRVAGLSNGNLVVTWTDGWDYFTFADHPGSLGQGGATGDPYENAVKAQVLTPLGQRVGPEIRVNTTVWDDQNAQEITALAGGGFVITYQDFSLGWGGGEVTNGNFPGIRAQAFDNTGGKLGGELTIAGDFQRAPQIAALAGGGFVVAWHDGRYSVNDVYAQVYTAAGTIASGPALVNTGGAGETLSFQTEHRVTALAGGGFVVTWTDDGKGAGGAAGDSSATAVKAQVYSASGTRIGAEILVNTRVEGDQRSASADALENGGFVVVWENWAPDDQGGPNVQGQIFNAGGARVGSEFLLSDSAAGTQLQARVAGLEGGGFVTAWSHAGEDIRAQVFSDTGVRAGNEIAVDRGIDGYQDSPLLEALDDGRFVVSWTERFTTTSVDNSGFGLRAQVFSNAGNTHSGADTDDILLGGAGSDRMLGLEGDDTLTGGAGNDSLDGGIGRDIAAYAGQSNRFHVDHIGAGWRVANTNGTEGTDTLAAIEQLRFADKSFELTAPARTTAPVYGGQGDFLFDPVFYLLNNAELVPTLNAANAAQHYLKFGAAEGRTPTSWFDAAYYENRWADLRSLALDDATLFMHYNKFGVWEGRSAGPAFDRFDGNRYLTDNPDVATYVNAHIADFLGSRTNGAIAHYVIYGEAEQRAAFETNGTQIQLDYGADLF